MRSILTILLTEHRSEHPGSFIDLSFGSYDDILCDDIVLCGISHFSHFFRYFLIVGEHIFLHISSGHRECILCELTHLYDICERRYRIESHCSDAFCEEIDLICEFFIELSEELVIILEVRTHYIPVTKSSILSRETIVCDELIESRERWNIFHKSDISY